MLQTIGLGLVFIVVLIPICGFVFTAFEQSQIEARFPPIGEFAEINGVRLHYVDLPAHDPDAPTIVFIHGASGNLRDPLLAFRPGLIGKFRLIFVDRPGHGYSTRGNRDVSSPVAQAELIHKLASGIGIDRAVIVGHSWGAAVAAAYAIKFQASTAGLMLLAPATHPWPGGVEWYYGVATTPLIGPIFARTLVMPIGFLQMSGSLRSVFAPTPVPPAYGNEAGIPLVLRPQEFLANAEDVANLKGNVIAMAPHYREITAPTVIFAGSEDTVVRNDLHADVLARDIAGAKLFTLTNAGHMPQFSAPEAVINELTLLAESTRIHGYASRNQSVAEQ